MRQPEVAGHLGTLLAALVLVAPVVVALRALVVATAFLLEFLSDGAHPVLTRLTAPPIAVALDADTDRYLPGGVFTGRPLVLVHGLAPAGKDDPRVQRAARLLARAGFDVAVPTVAGLTRARLRPEDAGVVVNALAARPGPTRLVSVSVGAGPAFLAAAHGAVRDRVSRVLALGAYASALELIRFHLTGVYAWNGIDGRVAPDDATAARAVIEANAELAAPALREALAGGDPAAVERALATLPAATRRLLDAVSPERVIGAIAAPIVLVHGRGDPAVPFTESLRLAAARPAGTRVVLVGAIGHVEGGAATGVTDFLRLAGVVYALVAAD